MFTIPVIKGICVHSYKVYTLVSETHENVDLVLGIKNVFELEGIINSTVVFYFLEYINYIFPRGNMEPKGKKFIKVEAPFVDEISGLFIVKY